MQKLYWHDHLDSYRLLMRKTKSFVLNLKGEHLWRTIGLQQLYRW